MSKKRAASASSIESCIKSSKFENLIKPSLFESDLKNKLSQAIKTETSFSSECGVQLKVDPFPVFVIQDFFSDPNFVCSLKEELSNLDFHQKSNDLYKFLQSNDLAGSSSKNVKMLREFLFTTFRKWLKEVMDVELHDTVDMSAAKFQQTDVLLCHDDELDTRRIAFIYYLVPETWNEADGGALDIFDTDNGGHPGSIVRSIVPACNSFAFFEVSDRSYHQVAEVLSEDSTRMTVVGWFHGTSLERRSLGPIANLPPEPALERPDELLLSWVNPMYLNPEIVTDIGEQFEDNSEIQLKDFLQADKYSAILEEITNTKDVSWRKQGPPNKRCYWSLQNNNIEGSVTQQFLELMKSTPFFKLLTKLTGLEMAVLEDDEDEEEEEDDDKNAGSASSSKPDKPSTTTKESAEPFTTPPSCVVEVRQWKHGCYTLLQDQDYCNGEFVLDALFHMDADTWDEECEGGYVSYVAKDEGSELMRVEPLSNCLSLVYRDEETNRFVKYFNKHLADCCPRYFDVSAVYFEGVKE